MSGQPQKSVRFNQEYVQHFGVTAPASHSNPSYGSSSSVGAMQAITAEPLKNIPTPFARAGLETYHEVHNPEYNKDAAQLSVASGVNVPARYWTAAHAHHGAVESAMVNIPAVQLAPGVFQQTSTGLGLPTRYTIAPTRQRTQPPSYGVHMAPGTYTFGGLGEGMQYTPPPLQQQQTSRWPVNGNYYNRSQQAQLRAARQHASANPGIPTFTSSALGAGTGTETTGTSSSSSTQGQMQDTTNSAAPFEGLNNLGSPSWGGAKKRKTKGKKSKRKLQKKRAKKTKKHQR
jgi:hypothetical protein